MLKADYIEDLMPYKLTNIGVQFFCKPPNSIDRFKGFRMFMQSMCENYEGISFYFLEFKFNSIAVFAIKEGSVGICEDELVWWTNLIGSNDEVLNFDFNEEFGDYFVRESIEGLAPFFLNRIHYHRALIKNSNFWLWSEICERAMP